MKAPTLSDKTGYGGAIRELPRRLSVIFRVALSVTPSAVAAGSTTSQARL